MDRSVSRSRRFYLIFYVLVKGSGSLADIVMDGEYVEDIVRYLIHRENKYVLPNGFLNRFNPNSINDRTEIVSYMHRFQTIFHVSPTALFAGVRIFDHMLSMGYVPINMYLLVALVSLELAAKVDGSGSIENYKLILLSGNAYTLTQLLKMERKILRAIVYDLQLPDPVIFVTYYLKCIKLQKPHLRSSSFYIMECYCLNKCFSTLSTSLLAAAATFTAVTKFNPNFKDWDYYVPQYDSEVLRPIRAAMMAQVVIVRERPQFTRIYKKYATADQHSVSLRF